MRSSEREFCSEREGVSVERERYGLIKARNREYRRTDRGGQREFQSGRRAFSILERDYRIQRVMYTLFCEVAIGEKRREREREMGGVVVPMAVSLA